MCVPSPPRCDRTFIFKRLSWAFRRGCSENKLSEIVIKKEFQVWTITESTANEVGGSTKLMRGAKL